MLGKILSVLPRAVIVVNFVGMLLLLHDGVAPVSFSFHRPTQAPTLERVSKSATRGTPSEPLTPAINVSEEPSESPAFPAAASDPPTGRKNDNADKYVYVSFPDEGPESAMLADLLSRMAVRTLFEPVFRPATPLELVETLTHSMYTTMLLVGSVIFGTGILYLSWKVFHSIREAAYVEPVTLSFFCTIPGLRYLYNHIRHHLWGYPLQPRRRFASFVGASGSRKGLLDLDDTLFTGADAASRSQRDAPVRQEATPAAQASSSLSKRKVSIKGGSSASSSSSRRSSQLSRHDTVGTEERRKRHSIAVHTPPSSAPSSEASSPAPECPQRIRQGSFDDDSLHNQTRYLVHEASAVLSEDIASPKPSTLMVSRFIEESQETSEENNGASTEPTTASFEGSVDESAYTALSTAPSTFQYDLETINEEYSENTLISQNEDHLRPLTPFSTASSSEEAGPISSALSEELRRRRADWVRTMPLFNNDYSFLPPEVKEAAPQVESKLSRRLTAAALERAGSAGSNGGLEQSKLSRYFSRSRPLPLASDPSSQLIDALRLCTAWDQKDDFVTRKLMDADLTPPPGFSGRSGDYLLRDNPLLAAQGAPNYRPPSPYGYVDDRVGVSAESQSAFASLRSRRSSHIAPRQSYTERETTDIGQPSRHRDRMQSEHANNHEWKWFMEDGSVAPTPRRSVPSDLMDPAFEPPLRPHSTVASRRTVQAPVGSGCRSAGRASPDVISPPASAPHNQGHISLGIFDEIFTYPPDSQRAADASHMSRRII